MSARARYYYLFFMSINAMNPIRTTRKAIPRTELELGLHTKQALYPCATAVDAEENEIKLEDFIWSTCPHELR